MNSPADIQLPPNPYKRSPIKKREDLAGRTRELKLIRYYLSLTASGQSPHLALIGQRGVGKTSLLNGAESIARELKLLPVRLDMNEQKANSPWIFWHDLYQTLALAVVKAGCWGGIQGPIYAELLKMMYARQPGDLDKAVMQIPYVFSCHQGDINVFECPDALVVHDFETCIEELTNKGLVGIAILIDEADCLGKNIPLLQMFRNIFQTVEHCSLVLAGTEAVFPALSEVFSPIPRQFHRVDVKPFARWSDTRDLILRPLPKELHSTVAPKQNIFRDLHQLCGGAPDEVQLYCHHMYRSVQDGSSPRMVLSPQVFREVLREYRANTPANVEAVLNAIERLPDNLLFESNWPSRRALTCEENIRVAVLARELRTDKILTPNERDEIANQISCGYRFLYNAGIIEIDNSMRLTGAPLSSGFWKSYVELERGKRWSWSDLSLSAHINRLLLAALSKGVGAAGHLIIEPGDNIHTIIEFVRTGKTIPDASEYMPDLIQSALFANEHKLTHAADVSFEFTTPAGRLTTLVRFIEKCTSSLSEEKIGNWMKSHGELLSGNGITGAILSFIWWKLPSGSELHRLGRIWEYAIPAEFGQTESEVAVSLFDQGDIDGCAKAFSLMLADKEDHRTRNNLAFCQILTGDIAGGKENLEKSLLEQPECITKYNLGIAEYLLGNVQSATKSLRSALEHIRDSGNEEDREATYLLMLGRNGEKPTAESGIPVDAALLLNMWRIGEIQRPELESELAKIDPTNAPMWIQKFAID